MAAPALVTTLATTRELPSAALKSAASPAMPVSITATPTPRPVIPRCHSLSARIVFGNVVDSWPELTPWPLTLAFSDTATTWRLRASDLASRAGTLTARPWISERSAVTRPWCARTSLRACFWLKPGLNCAIATTVRDGALRATDASCALADGAASAAAVQSASGAITTARLALSRACRVLDNSGHLRAPLASQVSRRPSYLPP